MVFENHENRFFFACRNFSVTQVHFARLFVVALGLTRFARDSQETIVLSMLTDMHALAVGTVVCVHAKSMQESRCVAASEETIATRTLIPYDAKGLGIKTSFQDINDMQFGKGMSAMRIRQAQGRDRMLLFNALSMGVPPKLIIFNGFLVGAGAQHCQGQIRQRDRFATTMTIPTRNGDFGVTRAGSEWPARRAHSTACPNA